MKKRILLLALFSAAICVVSAHKSYCCESGKAKACPSWISVMPLNDGVAEDLVSDCVDLGNTTFVDGIAWSCPVNPEGNPVVDRAAVYAKRYLAAAPLLRAKSPVAQGILLQSTMGHVNPPGTPTPWQLVVKPDGGSIYRMCPLDERFLAYIAKACRTFSDARPDFFMIDDDTRLVWGGKPGCYCPLHLAEFAKRTGRGWTREEVVALLDKAVEERTAEEMRHAGIWEKFYFECMSRFFKVVRDNFDSGIPGMLCVCASSPHLRHAGDFARILAAPGQTPVVRGAGAPYHDRNLLHVVTMRGFYAMQRELVGKDVVFLQESDTCPHTLWATSATRAMNHLVMLALDGCKGAKMWITRTSNYHEKKSAKTYRKMFRENKGLMEWAAKTDFRQEGVAVPSCAPAALNFGDRYLGLMGIPYYYGKPERGEVSALTVETIEKLAKKELEEILSGAVIVDAAAAIWLSRNGYSDLIGVDAKPWQRKTVQFHEFESGRRTYQGRNAGFADLTEMKGGAKIASRLLNRPNLAAEAVFEAPGSVLFANARGGKVLSIANPLPVQEPRYYDAVMMSEDYKAAMVEWLRKLSGRLPGGVCYLGVGPVTCLAGRTGEGEKIVVLNSIDLDGDETPELMFEKAPSSVERLQCDGTWKEVRFEKAGEDVVRIHSRVSVQQAAIFRYR